jgi:hypothetical protein
VNGSLKVKSGNQPEFQSSIKKRTVNQTVVYCRIQKINSKSVEFGFYFLLRYVLFYF